MEYFEKLQPGHGPSLLHLQSFYDKSLYFPQFQLKEVTNIGIFGNSGNVLLRPDMGTFIDQHLDVWFRINHAPTLGFESYVGTKTTVRWIAFNAIQDVLQMVHQKRIQPEKEVWILWGPANKLMECHHSLQSYLSQSYAVKPLHIFQIQQSFLQAVDQWYQMQFRRNRLEQGIWWSSGFLLHFYLITYQEIFGKIELYCYGFHHKGYNSPMISYHYWDNREREVQHLTRQQQQVRGHRFSLEDSIYHQWKKQNRIHNL